MTPGLGSGLAFSLPYSQPHCHLNLHHSTRTVSITIVHPNLTCTRKSRPTSISGLGTRNDIRPSILLDIVGWLDLHRYQIEVRTFVGTDLDTTRKRERKTSTITSSRETTSAGRAFEVPSVSQVVQNFSPFPRTNTPPHACDDQGIHKSRPATLITRLTEPGFFVSGSGSGSSFRPGRGPEPDPI